MTPEDLAEVIADYVRPLRVKIAKIERELEDVRKAVPRHTGKWLPDRTYVLAEEVCWKGCSWRARRDGVTSEPPSADWYLTAKAGGSS